MNLLYHQSLITLIKKKGRLVGVSQELYAPMSRWPSWAHIPNKPTVSVDVKQHFNDNNRFSYTFPIVAFVFHDK